MNKYDFINLCDKTIISIETHSDGKRYVHYMGYGYDTGDIPELAYISIHTVKKHNHSIYQKLEVSSRDELLLYIELFRCCGRLAELTADPMETE